MSELLPILLFFQAVQERIDRERDLEQEFLLEMNAQGAAMGKSRIISFELMREINAENKAERAKRLQTQTQGNARRLDRPKRRNAK